MKSTTALQDRFIVIDELIFKNFKDEEIKMMKSDPRYFNVKQLRDVEYFKKKNLAEILREENINKYATFKIAREHIKKSLKSPILK